MVAKRPHQFHAFLKVLAKPETDAIAKHCASHTKSHNQGKAEVIPASNQGQAKHQGNARNDDAGNGQGIKGGNGKNKQGHCTGMQIEPVV